MSTPRQASSRLLLATAVMAMAPELVLAGEAPDASKPFSPEAHAVFLQFGAGDHTRTATVGFSWDLPWRKRWANGELSACMDTSLGRWWIKQDGAAGAPWVTQVGLTPVLRYRWLKKWPGWFAEVGIGANVLTPVFNDNNRRFSTAFNFGDHLALGRGFGEGMREELAVRVQHYSNGGIKQPNPGINFVQLRYSHRF